MSLPLSLLLLSLLFTRVMNDVDGADVVYVVSVCLVVVVRVVVVVFFVVI